MVGMLRFPRPNVLVDRREGPSEPYSGVFPMANDTFELVLEIEQTFIASGLASTIDLAGKFDLWRDRGRAFWAPFGISNRE